MDRTKEFFDNYANKWDEVNRYDRPQKDFEGLVEKLGLTEGSAVVDLGCGTGILVPYLLDKVGGSGLIYAVDVSEKMLERLSKKFTNRNIRTMPLKAERLSAIGDEVDAVMCFSTFPHIEDKPKALREIAKVLRPNGRFLIAHFSSRKEMNDFHAGLSEPICRHLLPDRIEMEGMLEDSGFKIINFIDEPSRYELLAERRN